MEDESPSFAYLKKYGAQHQFFIAKAFDMKADEMIAAGADPGHPAVQHMRDRAAMFRVSPENN